MSKSAKQLADARSARDEAKAAFDAQLAHLRGDPEEQTIGGRLAERLGEDVKVAMDQALEVASESKGIIAGVVAAMALWFLRQPIIAWAAQILDHVSDENESETND